MNPRLSQLHNSYSRKAMSPEQYAKTATERQIQVAYFDYVRIKANTDWRYKLIAGNINQRVPQHEMALANYVAEGLKKGWPDIVIAIPKIEIITIGAFNTRTYPNIVIPSAYMEVKSDKGRLTKEQKEIHELLKKAGNKVEVVRSVEEMIEFTEWYLN